MDSGHIYLMGLMASGKSKLGKQLASKLNMPYKDLDSVIEDCAGHSINDIFTGQGEATFRQLEHECLLGLKDLSPHVISLGGGTPCSDRNIDFILSSGKAVYIKVPIPILVSRLDGKTDSRPLIAGKSAHDIALFLEAQLYVREPFYERAHHTIEHKGNLTANDLVSILSA